VIKAHTSLGRLEDGRLVHEQFIQRFYYEIIMLGIQIKFCQMSLLPQVIAWRHEKIVTFFLQIVIFNLL
jgi:hypothetical protein